MTLPCARSTAMPLESANPCNPGARCRCAYCTSSRDLGPGISVWMWGAFTKCPLSRVRYPTPQLVARTLVTQNQASGFRVRTAGERGSQAAFPRGLKPELRGRRLQKAGIEEGLLA